MVLTKMVVISGAARTLATIMDCFDMLNARVSPHSGCPSMSLADVHPSFLQMCMHRVRMKGTMLRHG